MVSKMKDPRGNAKVFELANIIIFINQVNFLDIIPQFYHCDLVDTQVQVQIRLD
jgi:hypothetical protein